jgi:hypothetical protein
MSEKLSTPNSIANNFALEEQPVGDTGRVLIVAESYGNNIEHPHPVNAPEVKNDDGHVKTRHITYRQTELGGKPFIVAERPSSSKRSVPRIGEPVTVVSPPSFDSKDKAPDTSNSKEPSDDSALNRKEILKRVRKDMLGVLGKTALGRTWQAKNEKGSLGRRNKRAAGIVDPGEYKKPVNKIVFKEKPTDTQVQELAAEQAQAEQAEEAGKLAAEQARQARYETEAERANRNEPDPSSMKEDEDSTKGKRKRVGGSRRNQSPSNARVRTV